MDKARLLERAAQNAEERLTLARVLDKFEQSHQRNLPTETGFLSPQEQAAAKALLAAAGVREGFCFYGGFEGAERCKLLFAPDWMEVEDLPAQCGITAVQCRFYEGDKLSHRDFLGSLMGLGLVREKIGDILVQSGNAVILADTSVEDFLLPVEKFSYAREASPQFVMIHFTSNVMANREDPYNMDDLRAIFVDYEVSTHYIISRDGTVYCYIPEDRVAWHAGKGEWGGNPAFTNKMNYHSIGIELAAIGSQSDMEIYLTKAEYNALDESLIGFTDAQYDALALLVADICSRYDIPLDREHVIGHDEYASRKADPGELFDWSRIIP